jgi:hypothetical protein
MKTCSGKVEFAMVNGCRVKDDVNINAAMIWKRLKENDDPASIPSLVRREARRVTKYNLFMIYSPDNLASGYELYCSQGLDDNI